MKYYMVDAFTQEVFKGNPAGVCIVEEPLSDIQMQAIAKENNLSETAFVSRCGGKYFLRWFTPAFEIDLCGHATLATAYVIFNYVQPELQEISFETMSGVLTVVKQEEQYEMSFPKRLPKAITISSEIVENVGVEPVEVYADRDLYILLKDEQSVKDYVPDYEKLRKLKQWLGLVVTAPGENSDFVSRYFCTELFLEDPVTGSTHSSLIPLWSEKQGKNRLLAQQLSERGGILYCEMGEECVKITGNAVLYLKGEIWG